MSRDAALYLKDIETSCRKILDYTKGLSQDEFIFDAKTYDAVLRNLGIIGEAAKKVPEGVRKKYPAIEWKKICGMREIVIHEYFGISRTILWDVIENKIPDLLKALAGEHD